MAGVRGRLFNALAKDPNFEYVLIDSTICKAHADATGARGDSGDRALARRIEWFGGIDHVIADAAYDAGRLRALIVDSLGAEAQIQANPSRAIKPPLDPDLYAERHKVENFFDQIRCFRRIALRCGKTLTSFKGFVFLAFALNWRSCADRTPNPVENEAFPCFFRGLRTSLTPPVSEQIYG